MSDKSDGSYNGLAKGPQKIPMTKAIQRSGALVLADAKSCTDRVLHVEDADVVDD